MNPIVPNEDLLYFGREGPMFRLMQRIGVARLVGLSIGRRCVLFLLLTWVPMLVLSILQGQALGPTPRESFLLDFASYARFFVAIPLVLVAEAVVGPRLTVAGLHFLRAGFVHQDDYPAFEQAIARVARRRESVLATVILIGLAVIGAWFFTAETMHGGYKASWNAISLSGSGVSRLSWAGVWNHLVAVPIIQFLWYRWLWRILNWTLFLRDVNRMKLDLVPTHADGAGGLGFLSTAHVSLGIFAFALSSIYSAEAAFRIVFEGAKIDTFKIPLVILLAVTQVLFLGPLLIFSSKMALSRRRGLKEYGILVDRYNREFHRKWIEGEAPEGEPLLGSGDIQSLADLGNSYRFISEMRIVPFGRRAVLQLAVATALPALPLLFLVMPVAKILDALAGVVL
ncbi:hypothetical protein LLG95_16825 [bacterium]|nr:hypothetical protein [bacterium]